jgi:Sulfotransferase family
VAVPHDEPQRWFFMHIPKTAGTALYYRLVRIHGMALYPLPPDRGEPQAYLEMDRVEHDFADHRDQLRVVTGHFPLCVGERLGVPLTTFTLLRDPVERTLSFLRQRRERSPEYRDLSLEDVYAVPYLLHGWIHNYVVKVLTMTADEAVYGAGTMVPYDEARLELAKHNLEHRVDIFGLQEEFDDFSERLAARYGWDLGERAAQINRTAPSLVSDEFRARIAHDNAFDVELYAFARNLLESRSRAAAGVPSPGR